MLRLICNYPVECLATFATIIPVVTFTWESAYKKPGIKFIFWFLAFKLFVELIMFYMASSKTSNLYLSNLLTIAGYLLLSGFFLSILNTYKQEAILSIGSTIFIASCVIDIHRDGIYDSFRYSGVVMCVLITGYCMMYFAGLIKSLKVVSLWRSPEFIICCALLLNYSTCAFFTPLQYYLDRFPADQNYRTFVLIPYIIEIVYLLIISVAILVEE